MHQRQSMGQLGSSKSILVISPQPFLANRGSPLRVATEVAALASLGYQIDLLVFPLGEDTSIPQTTIYRSASVPFIKDVPVGPSFKKLVLNVPFAIAAFNRMRKKRYAVIHGIEEAGFFAAALGKAFRVPYVMDMHSLLPDQLRYSGFVTFSPLLRLTYASYDACLRHAAGIVAVCEEVRDYAKEKAPLTPCCQLEDLPVESTTTIDQSLLEELKTRFGLHGKTVLLYTGNFASYQGISLLLQAFQHALINAPGDFRERARLVLVGESSPTLIAEHKELITALGLSEHVVLTGELPTDWMGTVMALSSALVSPRLKGGNTPLKVYCYMASGIPIVATRISSHTQVLDDDNAFLGDPTPESLSKQIAYALQDSVELDQLRQTKVERCYEMIESRFNKRVFTKVLGDLYTKVTCSQVPNPNWETEIPLPNLPRKISSLNEESAFPVGAKQALYSILPVISPFLTFLI